MSSQRLATSILQNALQANQDDVLAMDLLRAVRQQADCMYETEHVRTMLSSDPFEHFEAIRPKIDRLSQSLQVTEVMRTNTLYGYSYIDATVTISVKSLSSKSAGGKRRSSPDSPSNVQLYFKYEREAEHAKRKNVFPGQDPPTLRYSIDMACDAGPRRRLLWVQVWADGNRPNNFRTAINLEEGDDEDVDGWEDINDDDDDGQDLKLLKKDSHSKSSSVDQPTENESKPHGGKNDSDQKEEEEQQQQQRQRDRFIAAMDPDVLHQFLEWIDLDSINEDTAFFLFMTFPFYEHEWDIIGFVLESVFGYDKDQDGSDEDDGEVLMDEVG